MIVLNFMKSLFPSLLMSILLTVVYPVKAADTPINCEFCEEWNQPQMPFRIYGNTYYVGVKGLSSVLVVSSKGLILLDGGLPQSVPLIKKNLRVLGLRIQDIKYILNSHAHYDHAGGIAGLKKASGAVVVASASGAQVLQAGELGTDDPQYHKTKPVKFPAVKTVQVIKDGETIRLGNVVITAHLTPGHTPGSTTWTWVSCEQKRCKNIVYADSLNPVSTEGFRFTGDAQHPDISQQFQESITKVRNLPCDSMVSVHPGFSDLFEKLEQRQKNPATNPFMDTQACVRYADGAQARLQKRLKEEQ
jgi:metallo-beta-lactamase class B